MARDVVVYGTTVSGNVMTCAAIRPAALLMSDLRTTEALKFTSTVTRGTFLIGGRARQPRWPDAAVRLTGDRASVQLKLDSRGRFEAFGLPPGVYRVTLVAPDVRQGSPLSIAVPRRGAVDQTYIVWRHGPSERMRETFKSAQFYMRSIIEVVQETIAGK
jgi:hypothetical protein